MFTLSKKEEEIMNVIWQENREMSSADIIKSSLNKSWKSGSIFILLNTLLEKGAIEMSGFVKSQTNYGRTFKSTLTQSEYLIMQVKQIFQSGTLTTPDLLTGLIEDEQDNEIIMKLEKIIQNKMDEM